MMHIRDIFIMQFLQVVENQLRDNEPPETRQTLARLVNEGYSEHQAKTLISTCVGKELVEAIHFETIQDKNRYVNNLHNLPELPL